MNGYVFFYGGKQIEVYADSLYEAYCKAVEAFKPPKSKQHRVHGMLAKRDGQPVIHDGAMLP